MRAFIASIGGVPRNVNCYAAWLGFKDMGYETVPYFAPDELSRATRDDVVVGGLGIVFRANA